MDTQVSPRLAFIGMGLMGQVRVLSTYNALMIQTSANFFVGNVNEFN